MGIQIEASDTGTKSLALHALSLHPVLEEAY
jgi:hypothetical protein